MLSVNQLMIGCYLPEIIIFYIDTGLSGKDFA